MAMQSQHGLLYCIGEWEAKQGETRQACSKRGEASYLFIVLDKAEVFVAAARNARVSKTQLCDMAMGKIWWGVLCGTYGGKNSIVGIVLWRIFIV
jgi:hypothetical protein